MDHNKGYKTHDMGLVT